jgi:hypothetical protein
MIDIVVPETCWAYHKCNKTLSSIYLVLLLHLSRTMHGPIYIKLSWTVRSLNMKALGSSSAQWRTQSSTQHHMSEDMNTQWMRPIGELFPLFWQRDAIRVFVRFTDLYGKQRKGVVICVISSLIFYVWRRESIKIHVKILIDSPTSAEITKLFIVSLFTNMTLVYTSKSECMLLCFRLFIVSLMNYVLYSLIYSSAINGNVFIKC